MRTQHDTTRISRGWAHNGLCQDEDTQPRDTWAYVGRHRSHGGAITGLEFGTREDGRVSLVSVGEDRCLVEYNLPESDQVTARPPAPKADVTEESGQLSTIDYLACYISTIRCNFRPQESLSGPE